MICPNCGTNLEDGSKECFFCGYDLTGEPVPTEPEPKPEPEPEPKTEPEPKPEPESAPKPESNPESKVEPKPEPKVEPKPEPKPDPEPEKNITTDVKPSKPKSKKKAGIIGGIIAAGAAAGVIVPLVIFNVGKPNLTLEEQLESLQAKAETASAEEYDEIIKEAEEIKKKLDESELASIEAESETQTTESTTAQTETQTQETATSTQEQTQQAGFVGTSSETKAQAQETTAFDSAKTETQAKASRYEAVKKDISWSDAITECKNKGGHLATVTSESEMNELISLAESKGLRYVWLGGYTVVLDDNVYSYWLTDEPFNYSKWYPGEPSGKDEDGELEGALMMWRINGEWTWNDQRDDVVNSGLDYFKGYTGYICEYD